MVSSQKGTLKLRQRTHEKAPTGAGPTVRLESVSSRAFLWFQELGVDGPVPTPHWKLLLMLHAPTQMSPLPWRSPAPVSRGLLHLFSHSLSPASEWDLH